MKKLLAIFVMLLLSLNVVMAQNGFMARAEVKEQLITQSKVTGLENAMLRVQNQERVQHLEQIMGKIQTKDRERLQNLTNLVISEDENTERIEAIGYKQAESMYFIKMNHSYKYSVSEEGALQRQKRWFDFMWEDLEE